MSDKKDRLIHILITGGTIDSVYNAVKITAVTSKHSFIPEYFEQLLPSLKPYNDIKFSEIFMKDSRDLANEDRKNILRAVEDSEATKIIITHGTYTMPETARFIKDNLKEKNKVIVLVGSMVPLKGFDFSDAPFNLGYAFAKVQELPTRVTY